MPRNTSPYNDNPPSYEEMLKEEKQEAFFDAVKRGEIDLVEKFISEDADIINAQDGGYTPLHCAVERDNEKLVRYLIKCDKVNLNIKNKAGDTPLKMARDFERTEIANVLSEQDKLNKKLVNAIRTGSEHFTREAIEQGANVNAIDDNGNTPLHLAAFNGYTELVGTLIEKKANVDIQNNYGNTPLHLAALKGHTESAGKLVEGRANVDIQNNYGNTPLNLAARNGHTKSAGVLIEGRANVNIPNSRGSTPLHWAAEKGHIEPVRILVIKGEANVNIKNKNGNTPLHLAVKANNLKLLEYLAKFKGIDLSAQNNNGDTPLFLAYESGKEKALKILVEAGDNVNIKDKNGDTLLHLAIKTNNLKLLKCLVTLKGIDLNARDGYEDTPLLCAYKNGKKEALEILLKAGADVNMKDKDGNTILGEMRNQAILLCFGIFVVSLVVQFMILGVVSLESTIGEFSIPPLKTLVCIFVAVAAAVSIIGSSILYAGARSYIHFIKVEAEAEAGKFEPTDDNPHPYEA